ncbi:MAG TPA: phosphogluconate dehydratase [Pseudomonadaceae bacterium]|nr:phosphogluconate dehydratase [Pseudomonadaceae bacterium]
MHPGLEKVTHRIRQRSQASRSAYLERVEASISQGPQRQHLACGNLAHAQAACTAHDKQVMSNSAQANIAIVSAYNDMLSAHQPYKSFPEQIKQAICEAGSVAQFAGGVPAMCDGVTQGRPGMELSLFSRDVIAMGTAVALSHDCFDGVLLLGICDKIVPGLLIGALHFGHLPTLFVPAGPMPSGLPNKEKQRIRQLYAEDKIDRKALFEAEAASYHSPGTCTFYGTANSNQLMMELMGLHLPGSSFINPNTPLRDALTAAASRQILSFTASGQDHRPLGKLVDERAIVNAMVGLLATGGSTNHSIHLVAIAKAAGLRIDWSDFNDLSAIVPLMTRIYPNGEEDINAFQEAGGMAVLIASLLESGLLHDDLPTMGTEKGLQQYCQEPVLQGDQLHWRPGPAATLNSSVLRPATAPFSTSGGLHLVSGNLGRAIIKVSAVAPEHRRIEAPALVFEEQDALLDAFRRGELERDFVAVIRNQGPHANGMPELHQLTPTLGVLLDRGFKVALCTDGRMSGASGKVPAAIHLSPESKRGGLLSKVHNGDMIRLDADLGILELLVPEQELQNRIAVADHSRDHQHGFGRELFELFRSQVSGAEAGATTFGNADV